MCGTAAKRSLGRLNYQEENYNHVLTKKTTGEKFVPSVAYSRGTVRVQPCDLVRRKLQKMI